MPTTLKIAIRSLLKTPGFTITVLATLALCLAANVAIYAVVDAVIVRSLPFPQSDRLVTMVNAYPGAGVPRGGTSLVNYYDRKHDMRSFSSMAIIQEGSARTVGGPDAPTRVQAADISPDFFKTLGVPLAMGREFSEQEMIYGADSVAVLTNEYWRNHFDSDPNILGKTFLNDGMPVSIVGVLPRGFRFLSCNAQFFRPAGREKGDLVPKNRHNNNYVSIARLAPGVTLAQAQAEMDAYNAVQLKDDPYKAVVAKVGYHTSVFDLRADHVREVRPMLLLLQAGVALLFLIGAVNLANLFLIRSSERAKELAVRQALGARAWHIASVILAETGIVAVAGGVLGILLGAFGVRVIRLIGTDALPLGASIQFDGRVALAALAGAAVAAVLLAAPAAWISLRGGLAAGLRSESRSGTSGPGVQRLRHLFIVVQVALAFVLIAGAGLLAVSLRRVLDVPTGFRPDHVYAGNIPLPWNSYKTAEPRAQFVERLIPALEAIPGVSNAAISTNLPFNGPGDNSAIVVLDNPTHSPIHAHYIISVTGSYWATMHIPLRTGRLFTDNECRSKARVVVVDRAFATHYWPGGSALDKLILPRIDDDPSKAYRIVGVVDTVKQMDLTEDTGHGAVYFPYPNDELQTNFFAIVVESQLPEATLAPMVRHAMAGIDRQIPLAQFRSMDDRIGETLVTRRSPVILAAVFAGVALMLAAVGTYGVLSYAVSQRQREIGVRMALGALPAQIQAQFLRLGATLLVIGFAAGIAGSWVAGKAMQAILFEVSPLQPLVLAGAFVVMGLVALCACLLPARRASHVDPIVALRDE
ncbi:MAG TPA: ABC transporter permease [Opitutaceae bacterium]|jgi:predicted permease